MAWTEKTLWRAPSSLLIGYAAGYGEGEHTGGVGDSSLWVRAVEVKDAAGIGAGAVRDAATGRQSCRRRSNLTFMSLPHA